MTALAKHTRANREFFERGCAPHVSQWVDWIQRGVVPGKLIDGKPYVDLNVFAVSQKLEAPAPAPARVTGMDLHRRRLRG